MMAKETQTWPRMKIAQRSVRRNVTHFFCGDRNSSKNREETANFRRLRSVGLTQSGRCRAWQKCLVYLPNFFQGWLPLNQKRKPCHRHTHKPTHARTQTHTRTHRKARGSEIEWMEVEAAMVKSQCHPPTVRTHDIATRSRATKKKKKKKKKHTIKSSSNSNQIATTRFFFFFLCFIGDTTAEPKRAKLGECPKSKHTAPVQGIQQGSTSTEQNRTRRRGKRGGRKHRHKKKKKKKKPKPVFYGQSPRFDSHATTSFLFLPVCLCVCVSACLCVCVFLTHSPTPLSPPLLACFWIIIFLCVPVCKEPLPNRPSAVRIPHTDPTGKQSARFLPVSYTCADAHKSHSHSLTLTPTRSLTTLLHSLTTLLHSLTTLLHSLAHARTLPLPLPSSLSFFFTPSLPFHSSRLPSSLVPSLLSLF